MDADQRIAVLRQALEDIARIQPLWNGGIRPPSREQMQGLIEQMKDTAREALVWAQ